MEAEAVRPDYAPCVGCGYCCRKVRCYIGTLMHGPGNNCPSLVWSGERWRCQLVLDHEELKTDPRISYDLHIGEGCCSPLNTDRRKYLSDAKR
jgi:hypothetical protein